MMTREELWEWNRKLYPVRMESDGVHKYMPPKELGAEWFYTEFGIESAPKFPDKCWSHIPEAWGNDVRLLIDQLKAMSPTIRFDQIKEKFCSLTVYYGAHPEYWNHIDKLIKECQDRLRLKGLHPAPVVER